MLGCASLLTVLLDFILTSNALRIHLRSCEGMGHAPSGSNYTVSINILATMDARNCEGTQPLSTSKRSFNFLTLFLDLTLSDFKYIIHIQPHLPRGGGSDHHSRLSDLLVNVHDTEYHSMFSQITILETYTCIPYLSQVKSFTANNMTANESYSQ